MSDEGAREEGVAVDPDFSILTDAADLQANLVGVADEHDGGALFIAGMGVENDTGVSFELMNRPLLGLEIFEGRFEDSVTHRAFEPDRAGGGENFAHEVELLDGHRLGPSSLFFGGSLLLRGHGRSDKA